MLTIIPRFKVQCGSGHMIYIYGTYFPLSQRQSGLLQYGEEHLHSTQGTQNQLKWGRWCQLDTTVTPFPHSPLGSTGLPEHLWSHRLHQPVRPPWFLPLCVMERGPHRCCPYRPEGKKRPSKMVPRTEGDFPTFGWKNSTSLLMSASVSGYFGWKRDRLLGPGICGKRKKTGQ